MTIYAYTQDEREEAEQVEREESEYRNEHRDPAYFDYWPSDEQMEMFKRGGR